MTKEFSRFPLWLPVLIGAGIAFYFTRSAPTPAWPYGVGLLVMLALGLGLQHNIRIRIAAIFLAALLLGALVASLRLASVAAPVLSEPIFFKRVEGVVEDIQHKEKKVRLVLKSPYVETLEISETPLRLSVTLKELTTPVSIGDRITLPATLFPPPAPAMPGAYDFARMFYFEQLGAVGFSPRQPEIVDHIGTDGWQERITRLRLAISDHLVAVMGKEAGAIASALMVGEQSRVSEEVADSMRASGIYHILSISGLHMALATGIIFYVVRLLLVLIPYTAIHWPVKKIAAITGLLGGAAYLLLAGYPVPAIRSYIMVACVMVAILCDRKGISMFSLAWAAIIILLLMPESIFTASFQLTFAATLAIVALYERYGHVLFHSNASVPQKIALYFFGLILTSLAASFYTTPLAIIHFNRMAVYGILTNMLIVPLSTFVIMPMALLAMLTMPMEWDAPFLAVLKHAIEWMVAGSNMVAAFPHANINLPAPNEIGIALIVIGGLWLAIWVTRQRLIGLVLIVLGLSTIALFKPYDLIVSDDAKRIAYRSESGQWAMLRGDTDSFEAELWARMQGVKTMLSRKEALKQFPELVCDASTCMVTRDKESFVFALKKDKNASLCKSGAELVITDSFLNCEEIPAIIDRGFVEEHGAVALRANPPTLETAQEKRGHWPWVKQNLVASEDAAITQ